MKTYTVSSSAIVQAFKLAKQKRSWWKIWRRKVKPVTLSAGAMDRYNRNCQCNISPEYCPVHAR